MGVGKDRGFAISNVAVTDGAFNGSGTLSNVTCPAAAASLAPTDQVTCTATYTVTQRDVDAGELHNTATAVGTPPNGPAGSVVSPPSTVDIPQAATPALTIVKSATPSTIAVAGQRLAYSFLVTNSGDVTVTDITILEGAFSGTGQLSAIECPAAAASLVPGGELTCTATYVVTQADIDKGSISNRATASGTDPIGAPVSSPPSRVKILSTALNKLGLIKRADTTDNNGDGTVDVGDTITWQLRARNLGATTISRLVVLDPSAGPATCLRRILPPGASTKCSVADHIITTADADAGHVLNTAVATGVVLGKNSIRSNPAHAAVKVEAQPRRIPGRHHRGGEPTLPFTGFALASAVRVAASVLLFGVFFMFIAAVRRRDA